MTDFFGPNLLQRYGNTLSLGPTLLADRAGHGGSVSYSSGRAPLYSDGTLLTEDSAPQLSDEVPAESARYRAEFEVQRVPRAEFSTEIAAAWEFASQSAPEEGSALPLSFISFQPALSQ